MSRLSYWIPGPPSLGRWQGPSCSVTDLQWRDIAGRWEERRGSDCSLAPRPLPPLPCVIAALSLPPQAQQPLFRHRLPVRWRWSDCTAYLSPGPSATRQCTVHCPSLIIYVRAHPDFMPSDAQRLTDKLAARPPCFQPWQGCASVSVPWALLDLLDSGSTRGQTFSGCVSCPALPRAPASPLIYPWVPSDDDTKQTFPEGGLRARGDSDKWPVPREPSLVRKTERRCQEQSRGDPRPGSESGTTLGARDAQTERAQMARGASGGGCKGQGR